MNEPPIAQSKEAAEQDIQWLQYAQEEQQKQPERLEEAAKNLMAVVGVCLTIFITNRPEGLADWTQGKFVLASVLWLLSILAGFYVSFPMKYKYNRDSVPSIKKKLANVVFVKQAALLVSLVLYVLGLGVAAYALVVGG